MSGTLALTALLLSGCGTEDMETGQTAFGVVNDSPVTGLSYRSGNISGETDSLGRFSYYPGSAYTFSLGALTLANVSASDMGETVTPGTMAASYPVADRKQAMLGLTRFFLTADFDRNPDNGIRLFPDLANRAGAWGNIPPAFVLDLTSSDAQTVLQGIQSANGSPTLNWVSEADAISHLNKSMACTYSGLYYGTLTNGDRIATVLNSNSSLTTYLYNLASNEIHVFEDVFLFSDLQADTVSNRKELNGTGTSTLKLRYSADIRNPDAISAAVDYGNGYSATDKLLGRVGWADARRRFAGSVRTSGYPYGRDYVFIVETYGSSNQTVSGTIFNMQSGSAANMQGNLVLGNLKAVASLNGRDIEISGTTSGGSYSQTWNATIVEKVNGVESQKTFSVPGCSPVL